MRAMGVFDHFSLTQRYHKTKKKIFIYFIRICVVFDVTYRLTIPISVPTYATGAYATRAYATGVSYQLRSDNDLTLETSYRSAE